MCRASLDEDDVEGDLHGDVEGVNSCERDLVYHHWAQCVEENLEGAEEGFPQDGVEEDSFECGGEVGIKSVYTKGFVVCKVVWLCS